MAQDKTKNGGNQEKEMGFFQKIIATIKKPFQKFKADNPYFMQTTKRINQTFTFFGRVNFRVKDGDFKQGSYVSILDGKGTIYGVAQEDYTFRGQDVTSFKLTDSTVRFPVGNDTVTAICCEITFQDGKKAEADLISDKLSNFKALLGIK